MIVKVHCPHCGKWLFSTDTVTKGIIYVWCRGCKEEVKINIKSH